MGVEFLALVVEYQFSAGSLEQEEGLHRHHHLCVDQHQQEGGDPGARRARCGLLLLFKNPDFHLTGSHYTVTLSLVSAVQLFDNIEPCLKLYS